MAVSLAPLTRLSTQVFRKKISYVYGYRSATLIGLRCAHAMPHRDLTHPPPSRPVVEEESIKDLELVAYIMERNPSAITGNDVDVGLGRVGPIILKFLRRQMLRIEGLKATRGLERHFTKYDSHDLAGLMNPEQGHLTYCQGDVIDVLWRCNDTWAMGLCRGRVGLFPLDHTSSDNFSLVFKGHTATSEAETSVIKGQILPTTPVSALTDPGKCQIYGPDEYGLVPEEILAPLKLPATEVRAQNKERYYEYTPLDRGQVRLIYITPENVEDFKASGRQSLFLTIAKKTLSRAQPYVAFSYCWGDPKDVKPVFANGKLLYIPTNLWLMLSWHMPGDDTNVYNQYDATRSVQQREPACFWADAICINQSDTLEKNHQIPLMQSIYEKASNVIAYVGESDNAMITGISMDVIAQARQGAKSAAEAQESAGRADWNSVEAFISQPLFRRSWVIQEIILSKEIKFVYSNMRILLSRIHDCALAMSENYLRPANSILGDTYGRRDADRETFDEGLRQVLNLSRFKAIWDQGGTLPFIEVLQKFRSARATDPRDKVYSLLSLAEEEYRRYIIPDYSESNTAVDVYEHLARCALQLQDLKILLPNAGISTKNPTLASWAPDWSYEPREAISGKLFSCSGTEDNGVSAYVSPFMKENRSKMTIRGSVIDKITWAGPRWSPGTDCELPDAGVPKATGNAMVAFYLAGSLLQQTEAAVAVGNSPHGGEDGLKAAIWQTLACGMMHGERRTVPADAAHYDAFLECLDDAVSGAPALFQGVGGRPVELPQGDTDEELHARLEKLSWDFGLGPLDPPKPGEGSASAAPVAPSARDEAKRRKAELEERAMPFLKALVRAQAGRRTCITASGRLGAVPDGAEEGDEVAVFFGHPVPYVVRRAGKDAQGELFRLVGHCYVHGVMDGELVDTGPVKDDAVLKGFEAASFGLI